MYRLAICEDDKAIRLQICGFCEEILNKMDIPFVLAEFSSAEELEESIFAQVEYDLLILDINMKGKSGMEFAQELRKKNNRVSIVFVSGCEEYLREGYSVQPLQFLLKPVTRRALEEAIATDRRLNHRNEMITLRSGGKTVVIEINGIVYIEILNHRLHIHTTENEHTFLQSLTDFERLLPSECFCRCHNSFLVNLKHIKEISRTELLLHCGTIIPVGRRYYSGIQSAFVRYLNL